MEKHSKENEYSILPPLLKDGEYQASALSFFCKIWLIAYISSGIILAMFEPELKVRWLVGSAAALVVGVVPLLLMHAGYLRLSCVAFPLLAWLGISFFAATAGGIMSAGTFTYIPLIPIAALLCGKRWGTAMFFLVVLTFLTFALLEVSGRLPNNVAGNEPMARWVYLMAPFALIWGIQHYNSNMVRPTFNKVVTETEGRKKAEEAKDNALHELNERVKELQTLYNAAKVCQNEDDPVADILQRFVDFVPQGWLYPENAVAKITIGEQEFSTPNFKLTKQTQEARLFTSYDECVAIQVSYLEPKPQLDEGPFSKEERHLINMLNKMLVSFLDKRYMLDALQKSEANLNTIFNTTNIAYTLIDEKLNILSQNAAAQRFGKREFGVAVQPGDPMSKFIPDNRRDEFNAQMEKVMQGDATRYEAAYAQEDGTNNWYNIGYFPIIKDNGGVWGFLMEVKDITQTKNAELAIRNLNENLELKVAERTQELIELNKDLEAFSYSVSHDLKSPIRAISGYSTIMLQKYNDQLNEDIVEFIKSINESALLMGQLIDGLLKFSLLGKASIAVGEIEMTALVEDVLRETQQTYAHVAYKINPNPLQNGYGDAALIRQVWANLISNAVKYSSKKPEPLIEFGSFNENGEVVYYVKDNGDGFDMKHAHKLFTIFNRLHTVTEFEGCGIGLATVSRILNKHNGRIWTKAEKGTGAIFYFTIGIQNAN